MRMRWDFVLSKDAESDFGKLGGTERVRVFKKLEWLAANFELIDPIPLSGEWKEFFKLRIGDIRVIYQPDYKKCFLKVCVIDRRDKVYR